VQVQTANPTGLSTYPPYPLNLAGKDVERIPTSRKVVALTFDAGANVDGVSSILATLAREHVPATFFLTGDFTRRYPQASRSIAGAGHRLGNHSVSHPHFPELTDSQARAQLAGAEPAVKDVTGATTRPLFRFPYGDTSTHAIAVVNGQGYLCVRWTVDSLGQQGTTGGRSTASVTQRVLAAAYPGEIVLMHAGSHPTDYSTLDADALPGIIAGLRQRGYTFVTLDALLIG
jgi:peptidoglycan/xylan/chitin deacetylase (PgdA/CDA1 family)